MAASVRTNDAPLVAPAPRTTSVFRSLPPMPGTSTRQSLTQRPERSRFVGATASTRIEDASSRTVPTLIDQASPKTREEEPLVLAEERADVGRLASDE
jgi:hypothetical protein